MKNTIVASILFHCPQCKEHFEFDHVGDGEFVSCPICETDYVTVKVGDKIKLEAAEQILLC